MHPLFTNGLSTAGPLSLIGCQRAERRMKGWKTGGRERQHLKGSHFSPGDERRETLFHSISLSVDLWVSACLKWKMICLKPDHFRSALNNFLNVTTGF